MPPRFRCRVLSLERPVRSMDPGRPDAAAGIGTPGGVLPADTAIRPGNAALRALSAAMRSLVEATTDPDSALNSMQRVRVTGRLVLDDRTHGTKTVFRNTDLSFDRGIGRRRHALQLQPMARMAVGRLRRVPRPSLAESRPCLSEATNLSLDEITLAGGLRSVGFDFDMAGFSPADDAARAGRGDRHGERAWIFRSGAGFFKLDDPDHEPLLIDKRDGRVPSRLEDERRGHRPNGAALRATRSSA